MELNDAINQEKALKSYWERRIKTIGGPKYAQKIAESEKDDLDLMSGDVTSYKYFIVFLDHREIDFMEVRRISPRQRTTRRVEKTKRKYFMDNWLQICL